MSKQMFLVLDTEHNRKQCQSHKIGRLLSSTNAGALDVKQVTVERQDKMLRPSKSHGGSINRVTDENYRWFEESAVNDFRPRLASDIVNLRHTGWYCDDMQGEKTFGVVLRLPNKRGFLAGCSDPYNWPDKGYGACLVENYVYDDEDTAARCADQIAEKYAEDAREADEQYRAEQDALEAEQEREDMIENLP